MGLEGVTGLTRGYRVTGGWKGLKGVTKSYKGFQRVTRGYRV